MKDENTHGTGELSLFLSPPPFLYKAKTGHLELVSSIWLVLVSCGGSQPWMYT